MITIVAKNHIKEDKLDEFLASARRLVEETSKNDSGCVRYELFQGLSEPQVLTIIEEWEDEDSLKKHMASEHFREASASFVGLVEGRGEIDLYQKLV